jgi:PAS domain S-box-containing protein
MDIEDKTKEELQKELTKLQREFAYLNAIRDIDNDKRIQLEQEFIITNKELTFQSEENAKRTAELILALEENYHSIFHGSPDGILVANAETKMISYANVAQCRMFGYTEEQFKTMSIVDIHPEETVAHTLAEFESVLRREKNFAENIQCLKRNGEMFYADISAAVVSNDGKIQLLGFFRDITGRKQAEQEMSYLNTSLEYKVKERTAQLDISNANLEKEIEARDKSVAELKQLSTRLTLATRAGGVGVWEYDIVNNVLVWDDQMFALYGIKNQDFSGAYKAWQAGIHPDDRERSYAENLKAISGEKEFDTEFRVIWPDRTTHNIRALAIVQRDDSGKPLRMVGTNWDITEQKQAAQIESELLKFSLQLTGIPVSEIAPAIRMALLRIGGFLGADRAYIFEINDTEKTIFNTYQWCNEGISPVIETIRDIPIEVFSKWIKKFHNHENILITTVKDLPESWQTEREILEPQGTQSLVIIPMFIGNNLMGFVGLDSVSNVREYKDSEINFLKVWGNMLAGLINHQQTEEIVEQTRRNFETFFNTIDDFLFVLDELGNIIHTNATVTRRLGYTPEELLGKSILMVHPTERRDEAGRIVGEMLAGTSEYCPIPLITKSEAYIPVETRVKAGLWDGMPAIFGVSKDVSAIKLSEEKFSKAFKSNSALMAISSFDGIFIDVNETFINKLGYSREELIGKTSRDLKLFIDPNLRTILTNNLSKNIPVREVEIDVQKKSGAKIIGLFSADLISIGEERCLLTMLVDITDRKRSEEDLNNAKNDAEKANRAKSEFLSRMSHELRTPMNSILGYAQLMEMGELKPSHKRGVNHILNNGRHLLDLINEVLDIAGIEAGRQILTPEPVLLSDLIHGIIDVVQIAADKRNVTLVLIDSLTNNPFVMADKLRLKQVLLNLTNNAIKYNRLDGFVSIKTELQPTDTQGNSSVRISISDTGNGIKPEDICKLFEPFQRIGANKTEIEGTGLGLMVVKKLTEAMGGTVGVESEPGVGSTFWIELPKSEQQGNFRSKEEADIRQIASIENEKDATILYLEDNLSNSELVEAIITEYRPTIQLVTSIYGRQTVKLAKEYKPGLILLDLDLPDVKGSEVLEMLMADPYTKSIPVIIISADAMPFQVDNLMAAGAMAYLTKPFVIVQFLRTIDRYINK